MEKRTVKLYQLPYSHFSAKVRIVLLEKGMQVDYPDIPSEAGDALDQYRLINPTGKVPCLIDGDFAVGEGEVIAEYLDGQYPEVPMLPEGEQQKARSRWLSRYHDLYVAPQVTVLFLLTMEASPEPEKIADEVEKLFSVLDILESVIEPSPYFFGDRFCLSDASHFLSFWYSLFLCEKFEHPLPSERFGKLTRWYNEVCQRESAAEVLRVCREFHGLDTTELERAA
jgi:glutathione S-transferase